MNAEIIKTILIIAGIAYVLGALTAAYIIIKVMRAINRVIVRAIIRALGGQCVG